MSELLNHPIFKNKFKLHTLEKKLKNGIMTVLALKADDDVEARLAASVIQLCKISNRAGAVGVLAYKFHKELGTNFALKIATEMIYDLTYKGFWKDKFSENDNRIVRHKFKNLEYWIAYSGEHPVYEDDFFSKRREPTGFKKEKYDWYLKYVINELKTDEKISFCNMLLLQPDEEHISTTEYIAVAQTRQAIFMEYYKLCDEYKKRMKNEKRTARKAQEQVC